MASCGADIIATDLRTKQTLSPSIKNLKVYKNISYTLEKHKVADFRNRDLVLHAAGIPKDNKYLKAAQLDGVPTFMSFALLVKILKELKFDKVQVIGITGTKGKSTTTAMVESILKAAGLRYHLAGNIRGVANLPILKKIKDGDIILAELDSWQLQGLHTIGYSPDIAIFTSFFEDHMNYYNGSMQEYFNDKAAIFQYQDSNGKLVYSQNAKDAITKYYSNEIKSEEHLADLDNLPKSWEYMIFGSHNMKNISLSFEVGRCLGISSRYIKEGLTLFSGVSGRFEFLGTSKKRGLLFFNDNNSTTPDSTIESLRSLKDQYPDKKIILIAGGSDKEFHYTQFAEYIAKHVSYVFLFPGKATDKICDALPTSYTSYTRALSMSTACNLALRQANDGDIIILSPAAASFGLFKNEYERNDQFVQKVKQYLKNY